MWLLLIPMALLVGFALGLMLAPQSLSKDRAEVIYRALKDRRSEPKIIDPDKDPDAIDERMRDLLEIGKV